MTARSSLYDSPGGLYDSPVIGAGRYQTTGDGWTRGSPAGAVFGPVSMEHYRRLCPGDLKNLSLGTDGARATCRASRGARRRSFCRASPERLAPKYSSRQNRAGPGAGCRVSLWTWDGEEPGHPCRPPPAGRRYKHRIGLMRLPGGRSTLLLARFRNTPRFVSRGEPCELGGFGLLDLDPCELGGETLWLAFRKLWSVGSLLEI